jgi:hypothetical protein
MRQIIDYKIIRDYSVTSLQTSVKFWLEHDWQPIGGVSVTHTESYAQAMVKYAAEQHIPNDAHTNGSHTRVN